MGPISSKKENYLFMNDPLSEQSFIIYAKWLNAIGSHNILNYSSTCYKSLLELDLMCEGTIRAMWMHLMSLLQCFLKNKSFKNDLDYCDDLSQGMNPIDSISDDPQKWMEKMTKDANHILECIPQVMHIKWQLYIHKIKEMRIQYLQVAHEKVLLFFDGLLKVIINHYNY